MAKQLDVISVLDGIGEGVEAFMDLAGMFVDVADLVTGKKVALSDETIRRFRQISNIVDPPIGEEDNDLRRSVIAGIREARVAIDGLELARSRRLQIVGDGGHSEG